MAKTRAPRKQPRRRPARPRAPTELLWAGSVQPIPDDLPFPGSFTATWLSGPRTWAGAKVLEGEQPTVLAASLLRVLQQTRTSPTIVCAPDEASVEVIRRIAPANVEVRVGIPAELAGDLPEAHEIILGKLRTCLADSTFRGGEPGLELDIRLLDLEPRVWRRVRVSGALALRELHEIIQSAMSWRNQHLHEFKVRRTTWGRRTEDADPRLEDDVLIELADAFKGKTTRIAYHYDFGDDWRFEIELHDRFQATAGEPIVRCTGGGGTAPPEDCGGVAGYFRMLEILSDPTERQHGDIADWLRQFPPTPFDQQAVDAKLRRWSIGMDVVNEISPYDNDLLVLTDRGNP